MSSNPGSWSQGKDRHTEVQQDSTAGLASRERIQKDSESGRVELVNKQRERTDYLKCGGSSGITGEFGKPTLVDAGAGNTSINHAPAFESVFARDKEALLAAAAAGLNPSRIESSSVVDGAVVHKDEHGRIDVTKTATGELRMFHYDSQGNLNGYVDENKHLWTKNSDGSWSCQHASIGYKMLSLSVKEDGTVVHTQANGLTYIENPDGSRFATKDGLFLGGTRAAGLDVGFTRDQTGRVSEIWFEGHNSLKRNADGSWTLSNFVADNGGGYDTHTGNLDVQTDDKGNFSYLEPDGSGHRVMVKMDGSTLEYDDKGRVITIQARGRSQEFTYNDEGAVIAVKGPGPDDLRISPDGRNWLDSAKGYSMGRAFVEQDGTLVYTDTEGKQLRIGTDGTTRVESLALSQGPDGKTTVSPMPDGSSLVTREDGSLAEYDKGGRLRWQQTREGYNEERGDAGQFLARRWPDGSRTEHDKQGHVTVMDDGHGNRRSFEYDAAGRLSAITGPDGTRWTSSGDGVWTSDRGNVWKGDIAISQDGVLSYKPDQAGWEPFTMDRYGQVRADSGNANYNEFVTERSYPGQENPGGLDAKRSQVRSTLAAVSKAMGRRSDSSLTAAGQTGATGESLNARMPMAQESSERQPGYKVLNLGITEGADRFGDNASRLPGDFIRIGDRFQVSIERFESLTGELKELATDVELAVLAGQAALGALDQAAGKLPGDIQQLQDDLINGRPAFINDISNLQTHLTETQKALEKLTGSADDGQPKPVTDKIQIEPIDQSGRMRKIVPFTDNKANSIFYDANDNVTGVGLGDGSAWKKQPDGSWAHYNKWGNRDGRQARDLKATSSGQVVAIGLDGQARKQNPDGTESPYLLTADERDKLNAKIAAASRKWYELADAVTETGQALGDGVRHTGGAAANLPAWLAQPLAYPLLPVDMVVGAVKGKSLKDSWLNADAVKTTDKLANWLDEQAKGLATEAERQWGAPGSFVGAFLRGGGNIVEGSEELAKDAMAEALHILDDLGKNTVNTASNVGGALARGDLGGAFGALVEGSAATAAGLVQDAAETVGQGFRNLGYVVAGKDGSDAVQNAQNWVKDRVGDAGRAVEQGFKTAGQAVSDGAQWVGDRVNDAGRAISDASGALVKGAGDAAQAVGNWMAGGMEQIKSFKLW